MIIQKNWEIKNIDFELRMSLSRELDVAPVIAQLLINRNIVDAEEARLFLSTDISGMHDPFLLKGMEEAVKRIEKARNCKEKVLIFGDYDVDGITSVVILYNLLVERGLEVINHIPHRMDDGYGLNHDIAEFARQKGVGLLIAVDCGITAIDAINTFNNLGIDVIIIDHHEPAEAGIPDAVAIINPKQKKCSYPFKDLAAVGLVAKLIHAVSGGMNEDVLNFAALGTIADVVPLRGENRVLVKNGLASINKTKNKGLFALMDSSKIMGKEIKPFHIGFVLGPRINAAGRMDSAHKSLDLFLSNDTKETYAIVRALEGFNLERQKMQRDMAQDAVEIVEREVNFKEHKIIVLSKEGWHKGILGIVASKITEKYYRPTILISVNDGIGTASARSIDGFHLYNALSDCGRYLEAYGGHKGAAGLTIKEDNIDPFRDMINKMAADNLENRKLIPAVCIDCELPFADINMHMVDTINSMEPFGAGNSEPLFCSRSLTVKSAPLVLGKDTLKFWVTDGNTSISAIGFGMAKYKEIVTLGQKIDLAYQLSIDDWNKAPEVQLRLKDIKLS